jgi:hypothetical protein
LYVLYNIYFFIDRTTFGIITILHTYCICNPFHLLYTDVADGESIVGVSISQARSVASISTVVLHGQVLQVGVPTTTPCVRASHPIHVLRADSISRSVAPDVYVEIYGQPLYALSPATYGQRSDGAGMTTVYVLVVDVPRASVTTRVTRYVPGAVYVCTGFCSVDDVPSPNVQLYVYGRYPPVYDVENISAVPTVGGNGDIDIPPVDIVLFHIPVPVYVYIPSLSGSGSVPVYTTRDVYALCPAVSVVTSVTV